MPYSLPWPRRGRGWYVTDLSTGRQVSLGVRDTGDRDAALAAYQLLVVPGCSDRDYLLEPPENGHQADARCSGPPPKPQRTVAQAVADFLVRADEKFARGRLGAGCLANYKLTLAHMVADLGGRPLDSLTADELEAWADRPAWSASTRNGYLGTVSTLLKWAGVRLSVRRPPKESRGAAVALCDEQFAAVLAAIPDAARGGQGDLKQLLVVLRETGARPQEMARLAAEDVNWSLGCTVLTEHKGKRHAATRPVQFTEAAMAVLRTQRERHGSGFLFRTKAGRPYKPGAIVRELRKVSKRVGFRVIAYGLRHAFATRALEAGIPDAVVAALMGHSNTNMVHKHYNHVSSNARVLREAAEKASTKKAG